MNFISQLISKTAFNLKSAQEQNKILAINSQNMGDAILKGDNQKILELLNNGFDINGPVFLQGGTWSKNSTYLQNAIWVGRASTVQLLLKHNANPNTESRGKYPLHWAIYASNFDLIEILLKHNANANSLCDMGKTPLHHLVCKSNKDDLFSYAKILLDNGADPFNTGNIKTDSINLSMEAGNIQLAAQILSYKESMDLNTQILKPHKFKKNSI